MLNLFSGDFESSITIYFELYQRLTSEKQMQLHFK